MRQNRDLKRLKLERGPDVDGLAVDALVLERRDAVALDLVADAAGDRDAAAERVGAAEVDRVIVGLREAPARPAFRDRSAETATRPVKRGSE